MAWSIVGVGTFVSAASGNLSPNEPSGCQEGDLLVACIGYRSNAAFTVPSGWTEIEVQNTGDIDATNGIASGMMAYIVRGASAPANTFTRTGGDLGMARIIAYRGNAASPLGAHSSNTVTLSATATTGTITTGAANSLIVAMCSAGDNLSHTAFDATDPGTASAATPDTTTAPTAGTWLERADTGSATGADGALAIADAVRATAGATGTIQCTVSGTGGHVMIAAEFLISNNINGSVNATLGAATLAATGALTIQGAVNASLAPLTSSATGSLAIEADFTNTLGALTLAATGSLGINGSVNATLGALLLDAQGSEPQPIEGALAVTLGELTLSASADLEIRGAVNASLGALTTNAAGSLAIRGSTNALLDPCTLVATGEGPPSDDGELVISYGWRDRYWPGNDKNNAGAGTWRHLIC